MSEEKKMNIALIAHNQKKEVMVQFCIAYSGILKKHNLFATASTGSQIIEATGLNVNRFLSGSLGGTQQIGARIAYNEIDILIFLRDPLTTDVNEPELSMLQKLCDIHNVPMATNLATAELIIQGLARGDLDWRFILYDR